MNIATYPLGPLKLQPKAVFFWLVARVLYVPCVEFQCVHCTQSKQRNNFVPLGRLIISEMSFTNCTDADNIRERRNAEEFVVIFVW